LTRYVGSGFLRGVGLGGLTNRERYKATNVSGCFNWGKPIAWHFARGSLEPTLKAPNPHVPCLRFPDRSDTQWTPKSRPEARKIPCSGAGRLQPALNSVGKGM